MSIWGDQWLCPCGTFNLFVRKKCRNCSEPALPNEVVVPVGEALSAGRLVDIKRKGEDY